MKTFLLGPFVTLLACTGAFAATDVSGRWASAPIYLILKQEGNKLSGSAGPTEKEQILTFANGAVEGDRVTFKAGSFQFSLKLNGDELQGEMRNGPTPRRYSSNASRTSPMPAPAPSKSHRSNARPRRPATASTLR